MGSTAPDASNNSVPGIPFMVHEAVDVLRRLKLTSNVPAAPMLPMAVIASAPAVHAVDGTLEVDDVVEVLEVEALVPVVVDVEW